MLSRIECLEPMDFLRGGHGYEGTSAFGLMFACIIFSLYQTRNIPFKKVENPTTGCFMRMGRPCWQVQASLCGPQAPPVCNYPIRRLSAEQAPKTPPTLCHM